MRIIISPTKKMTVTDDSFYSDSLPVFLNETKELLAYLKGCTYDELKKIWNCNASIATLNEQRIRTMNPANASSPAILSYEGLQFQYMAPGLFTPDQFDYIREHLRILSGFYGLLRPFDGVVPYRLEMQSKFSDRASLYEFWNSKLYDCLCSETDLIINLASKEYSRCITSFQHQPVTIITCHFLESHNGKLLEKGTIAKMARGEMVRFCAEQKITNPNLLKQFQRLQFHYNDSLSDEFNFIFIR